MLLVVISRKRLKIELKCLLSANMSHAWRIDWHNNGWPLMTLNDRIERYNLRWLSFLFTNDILNIHSTWRRWPIVDATYAVRVKAMPVDGYERWPIASRNWSVSSSYSWSERHKSSRDHLFHDHSAKTFVLNVN